MTYQQHDQKRKTTALKAISNNKVQGKQSKVIQSNV